MKGQFKNLIQLLDYFKDEETCKQYLAFQRWGTTPACPHCGCTKAYVTNRGFKCSEKTCHKKFTVTTGTIFENTKIKLRTWFAAMYLVTAHKKGISSLQLSRDLQITQKSAWFVLHRIREMLKDKAPQMLEGTVEADETYVGGKNKNRHASKKVENSQGRSAKDKTPVVGLLQRDGKVITHVVKETDSNTLHPIMVKQVASNATLITDAYRSYRGLEKHYNHIVIKHTEGNYITVGENHTNNIEGFWSLFKRGIIGFYHNVSPKHLHRYCNEFGYRYNERKVTDCTRFEDAVNKVGNARLTYNELIAEQ